MSLSAGTRLGPYEITTQIGVGGMGEVYRATDRNLGRDVAIKVLPEAFAQDAERLARFEREARTLASLNHPNIAIIHGLEQSGGVRALVMELVEGPTLADRIAQGPLSTDEALAIAKQIAEALEAAHEQGIVHRDLKPANVKVRDDGTVKVLDFGLAKMIGPPVAYAADAATVPKEGGPYVPDVGAGFSRPTASMSPTITTPAMTQLGVILGTAAYMAPEQARGKPVDKRSDIWAFGCVLFEMLAGRKAFDGEDVTDTIAAVVRAEPKWEALPTDVPAHIRLLLRRCLEKDRRKRIGDISTALFILGEHASMPAAPSAAVTDSPLPVTLWRRVRWPAAVLIASMVTAAGVWTLMRPDPPRVTRLQLNTSGASRLALYSNTVSVAITIDGSRVLYQGGAQGSAPILFARRLDQLESSLLTNQAFFPFVSPDGRWVGYGSQTALRKVAITGGSSLVVVRTAGGLRGATWGPDDTIVFATSELDTGLLRVPSDGGEPVALTRPDRSKGEGDHVLPRWLPGVNAVLFTITSATGPQDSAMSQIAVLDLRTPGALPKTLLRGGSDARYVATGHLVYLSGGSLWAVPFDAERLEIGASPPVVVVESMASVAGVAGVFDVAANGTLVYLSSSSLASPERQLVWVDRGGKEEVVRAQPRAYAYPRLSPDGTRVAVDIREDMNDIWVLDLKQGGFTRVTTHAGADRTPVWLDGEQLLYSSEMAGNPGVFMQRADGTGTPAQLSSAGTTPQFPLSVTPDGKKVILIQSGSTGTSNDLMLLDLERRASTKPVDSAKPPSNTGYTSSPRDVLPLVTDPMAQANGVVSPDGRWLAYQSSESGELEIYVRPFPDTKSGRHTVSTDTGMQPRWSRDGRELFYVSPRNNAMMSVRIGAGPAWSAGTPEKLFDTREYSLGTAFPYLNYDMGKDGRFLLVKPLTSFLKDSESDASLIVVQNWFEELKRLVVAN